MHAGLNNMIPAASAGSTKPPRLGRADLLRNFDKLVEMLGGDLATLLDRFRLDPAIFEAPDPFMPYEVLAGLLETSAAVLDCPDFGMRLADLQCRQNLPRSPFGVVMENAATLKDGIEYCAIYNNAVSGGTKYSFESDPHTAMTFLRMDFVVPGVTFRSQAVEHSLLRVALKLAELSGGAVKPSEVWFVHDRISASATYQKYFNSPVHFGRSRNGLRIPVGELDTPVINRDPMFYEIATSFVEQRYTATEPPLSADLRALIEQALIEGDCSCGAVASLMGLHPRTLQRRLREHGESFETIKDSVRGELALRYLQQSSLPLIRVAELLGYSEASALSRSCSRWFSATPKELRHAGQLAAQ